MRLTQYTDFSLRVLIYLGVNREARSTIRSISEAYGISQNHLMKVVQQLAAAGHIQSRRGKGGGIRLAREPTQISIGQVVRDMEPDFGLVECLRPENACVITTACALPGILGQAQSAFMNTLDHYTLADLLPTDRTRDLALHLRLTG